MTLRSMRKGSLRRVLRGPRHFAVFFSFFFFCFSLVESFGLFIFLSFSIPLAMSVASFVAQPRATGAPASRLLQSPRRVRSGFMLKHNTFFDGKVQSIGFERLGRRMTAGVIAPGEYHFDTSAPERMAVVSGELEAKVAGAWQTYPAGTSFEVAGKSGFDVRARAPAAYLCEFL